MDSSVVEERYWTPEEIAERLKLSKGTVYGLLRAGELPAIKIGSQWRVSESDLDAFLRRKKSGPEGGPDLR